MIIKIKEAIGSSLFVIAILLVVSLFTIMPVLNMLILGAVIAYGIRPIANRINSKVKFSSISIILSIIVVVIPLILIFAYTIFSVVNVSYSLISNNNITGFFNFDQGIAIVNKYLPVEVQSSTVAITKTLSQLINDLLQMIFTYFLDFVKSLPMVMLQIFILLFSTFYFVKDGSNVKKYAFSFIPEERHEFFSNMIVEIKKVLKSIFYGHFLTGLIIGTIATVGFYILGYPYALFLGILTGIFQLIPVIGPWPTYISLFLYDIVSHNYIRAFIVLFFGFGLSLSDMYIRPTLSSRYINIHPLILLVGFLSGPIVFGLVGFILGPLILGITYAVVKTYKDEKENELTTNQ